MKSKDPLDLFLDEEVGVMVKRKESSININPRKGIRLDDIFLLLNFLMFL